MATAPDPKEEFEEIGQKMRALLTESKEDSEKDEASESDEENNEERSDEEKVSSEPDQDKFLEEIDKIDESTLPQSLSVLDIQQIKEIYTNASSLSILITGKTGSGKSTLINGIVGFNVQGLTRPPAEEGDGIDSCTKEVTKYSTKKGKIDVTVWDSPGLQDGTQNQDEYLAAIKRECSERDLTIYCTPISNIRFVRGRENPDVLAMGELTKLFGPEFWKTAIIVLTFANTLGAINMHWNSLTPSEKAKEFKDKIKQWKIRIQEILVNDIKIPEEIANNVKVVPAGHYSKKNVYGYSYWLSALWFNCIGALSTVESRAAFVRLNYNRITMEENITADIETQPPEAQPIVISKKIKVLKITGITGGTMVTGAAIGAGIGMIGLIGGPVAAITAPVGAAVGSVVGFVVGALISHFKKF